MEFVAKKRSRKCKKKRRSKKRLRDQVRFEVEVRSTNHRRIFPRYINAINKQQTLTTDAMQADAFWKNYAVAQEWQKRHNITWWRSRCMALEYENGVLRSKLRSLAQSGYSDRVIPQTNNYHEDNGGEDAKVNKETGYKSDSEDFEFNVTEDMLSYLEITERHRREMKQKRKSKKTTNNEKFPVIGGAESFHAKKQEANLLYGDASSKILAMETALQATMDNYKDKVRPQYWPNIPLKP